MRVNTRDVNSTRGTSSNVGSNVSAEHCKAWTGCSLFLCLCWSAAPGDSETARSVWSGVVCRMLPWYITRNSTPCTLYCGCALYVQFIHNLIHYYVHEHEHELEYEHERVHAASPTAQASVLQLQTENGESLRIVTWNAIVLSVTTVNSSRNRSSFVRSVFV